MNNLEIRWSEWEQPLLILSFVLYPQLKRGITFGADNLPTMKTVSSWLLEYCKKWFPGVDTFGVRRSFHDYLTGE
eukprot:Pgem_evm1s16791